MRETLTKITEKYPPVEAEIINRAFEFASQIHAGPLRQSFSARSDSSETRREARQKRNSGEDYMIHPLKVAEILAELNLDFETVSAGLLHDVLEESDYKPEHLEKEFGANIAFLVRSVSKLHRVSYSGEPSSAPPSSETSDGRSKATEGQRGFIENFHKMILATAKDIRVVLIKLADRLHNLETLETFKGNKERIAREGLEIYAPLASRLGMGEIKGLMEDLAFPYVYPEDYQKLLRLASGQISENQKYADGLKPAVEKILKENNINYLALNARAKHLYSLWRKLQKYDFDLERIYDLVALRIIVPDVAACYETLGILHKYWQPLPGRIKDFIALAKPNGYQSLHTTVFCEDGKITEFQIRTPEMHQTADYGIAAHWGYKEQKNPLAKRYSWLRQLAEWQKQNMSASDFWEHAKIDFFQNRIFVFTPKGDVIELPEDATPVDFAYAVHSDLGNHCEQAKVNGKIMALDQALNDGDIVEIVMNKKKSPSRDWLKFIKTSKARSKIRESLRLIS
ncbi:MAG: bifunctional (p)ppGpp synthetase/guanosine-3',5'-bis(diphosphate) 3'-pyrophosphohydrolase [Parcubacteria group bacterium]|nr:bifunctional (p)ppGpp synthetase/guanosine-3',5'-bis(diphosphate) 3'-pyrophosphohydrolase [Parcubacteria group bacterium]